MNKGGEIFGAVYKCTNTQFSLHCSTVGRKEKTPIAAAALSTITEQNNHTLLLLGIGSSFLGVLYFLLNLECQLWILHKVTRQNPPLVGTTELRTSADITFFFN